jgi:hypothetical protein
MVALVVGIALAFLPLDFLEQRPGEPQVSASQAAGTPRATPSAPIAAVAPHVASAPQATVIEQAAPVPTPSVAPAPPEAAPPMVPSEETAASGSRNRARPPARPAPPTRPAPPIAARPTAPAPAPTPAQHDEPAPAQQAMGRLQLDAEPYAIVSLGGRRLGITPIDVQLPAGSCTLTLRNPEQGLSTTYRVTIPAGGSVSRRVALE